MAGATAAGVRAHRGSRGNVVPEAIGGAIGGLVGAWLPDALDPPNHPNHRGVGHSCVSLTGVSYLTANALPAVQRLRARAEILRKQADLVRLDEPMRALLLDLAAFLVLVLAGAITGMGVGYASHLLMDCTTSKGLPLIGFDTF